jgi:hypothetical protein
MLGRDEDEFYISQIDKDSYTYRCKNMFKSFSQFVALHYALSHRTDTEYWRDVGRRVYSPKIYDTNNFEDAFTRTFSSRLIDYRFDNSGVNAVATGLNYFATERNALESHVNDEEFYKKILKASHRLNKKRDYWAELVKNEPELIDILKEKIYYDEEG